MCFCAVNLEDWGKFRSCDRAHSPPPGPSFPRTSPLVDQRAPFTITAQAPDRTPREDCLFAEQTHRLGRPLDVTQPLHLLECLWVAIPQARPGITVVTEMFVIHYCEESGAMEVTRIFEQVRDQQDFNQPKRPRTLRNHNSRQSLVPL